MQALVLFASLGAITLGAEALVRGASAIALRAGISALFVGLTIVGFGTSSPELGASLTATLNDVIDVSVGNVVGSNIFNIAAILGLTALLRPIAVQLSAVRRDLLVAMAAATVPWASWLLGGSIPRWLGVLLVLGLCLYLRSAYRTARLAPREDRDLAREEVESTLAFPQATGRLANRLAIDVGLVIGGLILLVLGSKFFVGSAIILARTLGVSDLVIGLTVVAAGTSMPELVTSLVAARRNNPDIAIGNVIGSNIFNILGILGVSAVVKPQTVSPQVLWLDGPVMFVATLALLPVMRTGGIISRGEGAALLAGYLVYVAVLIAKGG